MSPPPTSTATATATLLSKAKTALLFLSIAMAMFLLLRTVYVHSVKHSSTTSFLFAANIIILFLVFHYRRNPDQIPHPSLYSFPSLSRQPREKTLKENSSDLPEPAVSLAPPVVLQHLETDTVYDSRSTDGMVWERGESSERISTEYREGEKSNYLASDQTDDDQGSSESMDQTWNSIVARGKAKPVRLFTSNQRERNPKTEMKKPTTGKRKEKKKVTENTNYDYGERRAEGWRKQGTTGISSDELSHLSEMFIRKQYNNLRIEREESDQRRLAKRLHFRDYRNAVSAV